MDLHQEEQNSMNQVIKMLVISVNKASLYYKDPSFLFPGRIIQLMEYNLISSSYQRMAMQQESSSLKQPSSSFLTNMGSQFTFFARCSSSEIQKVALLILNYELSHLFSENILIMQDIILRLLYFAAILTLMLC